MSNKKVKSKKKDLKNLLDKYYDDESKLKMEDIDEDVEKKQGRINKE